MNIPLATSSETRVQSTQPVGPSRASQRRDTKKIDWYSFFIGGLIFLIVFVIILWILYATHTFIFSYCITETEYCNSAQYYNNPANALANGADINKILFLNDKDEMFYKRVPIQKNCIPASDQTVQILVPQYCLFTMQNGSKIEGISEQFNLPVYDTPDGIIYTTNNCTPVLGSKAVSGIPELKWKSENN